MEIYWFLAATFLLTTLSIVPLTVDLLKIAIPHWKLSRIIGKGAHIFLLSTLSGLIFITIRYHHFVYLPLLLKNENPLDSIEGILHLIFSTWVWINILGNYYHTAFMHPGSDGRYFSRRMKFEYAKLASYGVEIEQAPTVEVNPDQDIATTSSGTPLASFIPRTKGIFQEKVGPVSGIYWKPKRTQFCTICCCAISYRDHHCPFTGNCIGLRNYSNFFLGLFYCVLGSTYALLLTWPFFYHCNVLPVFYSFDQQTVCMILGANSYIFLPTLLGFWVSICIFVSHVVLLLADLSTYDVLKNWERYPIGRFIMQRIYAGKFLDNDSRLRVLIINRRRGPFSYLIPLRNSKLSL